MVKIELVKNRIFHVKITDRSPFMHKPDGMTWEHTWISYQDRWLTEDQMESAMPEFWPLVEDVEFNHLAMGIEFATIEIWAEWF